MLLRNENTLDKEVIDRGSASEHDVSSVTARHRLVEEKKSSERLFFAHFKERIALAKQHEAAEFSANDSANFNSWYLYIIAQYEQQVCVSGRHAWSA